MLHELKKLTVVIPTYNEAGNIVSLLERLFAVAAMHQYDLRVLVVDDNSPDDTAGIVRSVQQQNPRIELLLGKKEGLGRAYLRGFKYVIENMSSDIVLQMDADFSHDPNAIPRLIAQIEAGSDYVIGSRYVSGASIPGNWSLFRILNSRVANFVAINFAGIDSRIRDISGGFKAISMAALKQIDLESIGTRGYGFQMHLLYAFQNAGFKISEVPTTFQERKSGSSKMSINDIIGFLQCAYGLNPNSPIRVLTRFLLVGIIGTVINLVTLALLSSYTNIVSIWNSAIATEISIIFNFILHTLFTFRATKTKPSSFFLRLTTYNITSIGTAILTVLVFSALHLALGFNYLIAQLLAIGVAFILNYWLVSSLVWKKNAPA